MIKKRINKLMQLMEEKNFDAYVVPSSDFHQSEYVADFFESRKFISGFTGSAGTVVIMRNGKHGLWTDGRYFLQAENELKNSGISLFKMYMPGVKTYEEWLFDNLEEDATIGLDGRLFSIEQIMNFEEILSDKYIEIDFSEDLIDEVWIERPKLPENKIFVHDIKYAGKTVSEKLSEVRSEMKRNYIDSFIISSLDDIAWVYNLRGTDIQNNPVFLAYTIITAKYAILYLDENKLSTEAKKQLSESDVVTKDYLEIFEDIKGIEDSKILLSNKKTSYYILEQIDESNVIIDEMNITTTLKSCKNEIEINNLKNVFIKDGVAMVKFLYWLDKNIKTETISEVDAANKLQSFRKEQDLYQQDSFNYISGYQENGAIIHYFAKKETCIDLKPKGLYLIDSGGQYLDGTTDITRTIVLGRLTDEQISDFTITLMGHINLATAKFLEGTFGANLDILARKPFWDRGLDYKHGTGHGVGFYLNVHEGPQSISRALIPVEIKKGMIISNEPGIYRANKHGVRIESLVLVSDFNETEFGKFFKFDTLTLCPIDIRAINTNMMNKDQINWLNEYHREVYNKINIYLNDDELDFLEKMTKEIK
jgi:Xaa-Pro aminopeptidase